jgi:hypothetical protein
MAADPNAPKHTLVIACGALARELRAVLAQFGGEQAVEVEYLPAPLHNRPEKIAPAVDALLTSRRTEFKHIAVAYADCGSGGHLDAVLARHGVQRLPGAHCYEFFTGTSPFEEMQQAELGTFYLTDFLARHFDQLVFSGLGLDRHPELRDMYFGNYTRVMLLSQSDAADVIEFGTQAAARLGLRFEHRHVGLDPFAAEIRRLIPLRVG